MKNFLWLLVAALALVGQPALAQQAVGGRVVSGSPGYVVGDTRPITLDVNGGLRVSSADAAAATPISSASSAGTTTQAVAIAPHTAASGAIVPTATSAVASVLVVKASAGNLYEWRVTSGASAGYVMLFNATAAPADGAVTPVDCVVVAANATVGSGTIIPERYSTGIVVVFSTTGCFTKTASATAYIRARAL